MGSENTIWMDLDALATSYKRIHGIRPDRLRIGLAVARELEPGSPHPPHLDWVSPVPGIWFPAAPPVQEHWWQRWQVRRACRREGGHYWHPDDAMIAWFCCHCGAERDGMPRDGT